MAVALTMCADSRNPVVLRLTVNGNAIGMAVNPVLISLMSGRDGDGNIEMLSLFPEMAAWLNNDDATTVHRNFHLKHTLERTILL